MTLAVVVVAAGDGQRLGSTLPKALVEIGGRTLLEHALERVTRVGASETVVVHHPDHEREFRTVGEDLGVTTFVAGGAERIDSVRAGVAAISSAAEVVAIHDAARAFTPPDVFARAVAAVRAGALAAAPGSPVRDTLKLVEDGLVLTTNPRQDRWSVQTPQVFDRAAFVTSLAHVGNTVTDDLSVVELARDQGVVRGDIQLVEGTYKALKVTYREDLELAAYLAAQPLEGS